MRVIPRTKGAPTMTIGALTTKNHIKISPVGFRRAIAQQLSGRT